MYCMTPSKLIFARQSFDDGCTDPHTNAVKSCLEENYNADILLVLEISSSRYPTTIARRQRKVGVERLARSSSRSSEINYARHRNLQPIPFCMRTRTAYDTNCTEKFKAQ
uniref:Uncharacterized protein n=1 Tax=Trichogramma kaykai TaxID=54128 RepID=A0ABD2XR61_9HYME